MSRELRWARGNASRGSVSVSGSEDLLKFPCTVHPANYVNS